MIWLSTGLFASFFLGSLFSLVTIINPPPAIPLFNALSAKLDRQGTERPGLDRGDHRRNGIEVMTRLMGFLLICIGVQFIASGIRTFVSGI